MVVNAKSFLVIHLSVRVYMCVISSHSRNSTFAIFSAKL